MPKIDQHSGKQEKLLSLDEVLQLPQEIKMADIRSLSAKQYAALLAELMVRNLNDPRNHDRSN